MAKKVERDTASLTVDRGNRELRGLVGQKVLSVCKPNAGDWMLSAAAAEPAFRSWRQVPILVLWQA